MSDPTSTPAETPDDPHTVTQTPSPVSGFIVGGCIAAAAFGASWFIQNGKIDALSAQVSDQSARIADLTDRLDTLPEPDLSGLEARITDARDNTAAQITELAGDTQTQMGVINDRLAAVEVMASGGVADASSASSYVRQVETRLAELEANASSITKASDELRAEAAQAEAAARAAEARARLAQINTALSNGDPFPDAVEALSKFTDVGDGLRAVATDGAPTLESLRDALPDAARAALATARNAGEAGEASGAIGGFLRKQLGVRSTTRRDGTSVDAILSRVTADMQDGNVPQALAETSALPEAAKTAMSDWIASAQAHVDAVNDAAALSQTLTQK